MRKLVLMLFLSVMSNHAMAELEQIGGYGGLTIYTDPSNINKEGNIVRMWNVYNYYTAKSGPGGKMYLSIDQQEEFDCEERKMRTLYFSYRSENKGEGEPVYSKSFSGDIRWDPIEPDSKSEYLFKYACGKSS
jgi:Surface-adhesin protein E